MSSLSALTRLEIENLMVCSHLGNAAVRWLENERFMSYLPSTIKWHRFTVRLQSVWTRLKSTQLCTCYANLIHEFLLLFPVCFIRFLRNLTNWHILNGNSAERVLTGKRWKHDWLLWMKNQSQPANHKSPSSCLRHTNIKDKWHSSWLIFAVAICLLFFFLFFRSAL